MGQHPPQFFGGYGGDALQHMPPDMAAQMFPDSHMFFDDPQDPKRRRIAKVRRDMISDLCNTRRNTIGPGDKGVHLC